MIDLLDWLKSDKRNLPNKFSIALGDLIRQARIEANMSQKDLAFNAYFNQASISQIETGKRSVTAEEIIYLSSALNKPIPYFFKYPGLIVIDDNSLSLQEQELLVNIRELPPEDIKKIIAQVKAIANIQ